MTIVFWGPFVKDGKKVNDTVLLKELLLFQKFHSIRLDATRPFDNLNVDVQESSSVSKTDVDNFKGTVG